MNPKGRVWAARGERWALGSQRVKLEHQDKDRLWDEYKYRHQHCWNMVFKLTAGVVLISIIPYTQREVACVLNWFAVALPIVAIALGVFGYKRMQRELDVFKKIKAEHRKVQGLVKPSERSSFDRHVKFFLCLLIVGAILNAAVLVLSWRPAVVGDKQGPNCFGNRQLT